MQVKMIAGHELTPGKTVKDHIHVEGTELHVPHVLLCGEQPGPTVLITAASTTRNTSAFRRPSSCPMSLTFPRCAAT